VTTGAERNELRGAEVAITGRLASMKREDAVRRLDAAGARYVPAPERTTDLVVVGQGGPPLDDDGRPTRALRAARALQRQGSGLRIVPETELLALLGLEQRREGLSRLYTAEQLGRILGVPRAHVNAWARQGLIEPAREHQRLRFFEFGQVAAARVLSRLVRAGVGPTRIQRSLERIARWLGEPGSALAQLEVLAGGTLLVRTDDGVLAESSGQLLLGFDERSPGPVPAPAPASARVTPAREDLFEQGVLFESMERLDEAVATYRDAVRGGDQRPEVRFNLGNVLFALGHHADAAEAFLQAIEGDPAFVEAWNNLGNALQELGKLGDAARAYRQALAIAPDYADAHYNLAETLCALGEHAEARRHWWSYLGQDPASPSADEVRARLARGLGV
jgi:tetratricopeptide (TPR) repeat protein